MEQDVFWDWVDAVNTATSRLYEAVSPISNPEKAIRLYEVLSIASGLCAIAIAIKEVNNDVSIESSRNP